MKNTSPKRYRFLIIGIILALGIALAPSPAQAGWSFSVYSPSGYLIIGSGGVVVGVAVVIGYIYFWGEARSLASLPPVQLGIMKNPAEFRDQRPPLELNLDLVSYRF